MTLAELKKHMVDVKYSLDVIRKQFSDSLTQLRKYRMNLTTCTYDILSDFVLVSSVVQFVL